MVERSIVGLGMRMTLVRDHLSSMAQSKQFKTQGMTMGKKVSGLERLTMESLTEVMIRQL